MCWALTQQQEDSPTEKWAEDPGTLTSRGHADGQQTHGKVLSITDRHGNANHHGGLPPHLSEWLPSVNQQTGAGEDVEKGSPRAPLVGL